MVIGVLGACGGAGASVLAALLAGVAASSGPAILLDCDPAGGGIDVLLGCERVDGPRWSQVRVAGGRMDPLVLLSALPRWARVPFLAVDSDASMTPEAVETVVDAARRTGTVVLDLPRWPGDLRHAAVSGCDRVVLVTPAEVRAAAAGISLLAKLPDADTVLAIRGRSKGLPPRQLGALFDLPVVGVIPYDGAVNQHDGLAVTRLRRRSRDFVARLLDELDCSSPLSGRSA
jgi:secretion/DNA translocation related CpaE-like protein